MNVVHRLFPCLALVSLGACDGADQQAPPPPPEVPFTAVTTQDVPIYVEAVGQTAGSLDIRIRARVEGIVDKLHFQEGKEVTAGQPLYDIDPEPFEAKLREANGQLAGAQAEFVRAESDLKRVEPLVAIDALSKRTLDDAKAKFEASRGLVDAAKAMVESATINLGYTKITSPIDGLIGVSEAYEGDFVGREPNPVVLNTVSKLDPIRVRFSISERDYLAAVQRGKREGPQDEEIPLELFFADGSKHPQLGKISFAGRELDPTTGTLLIEATFANPEQTIRPGQFARVRATVSTMEDAPLIPQRAVQEIQGIYQVVVLGDGDTAEVRQITLGRRIDDLWLVTSGLQKGDRVAVGNLHRVRPGAKLTPTTASEPAEGKDS